MNSNVYGIDLGTCNMKIYCKSSNKILNEKNTIALVKKDQIYAYGDAAYAMYEKAPETINVTFPVISGVIADFNNLQNMLQLSGGEKALTAIALLFAIQNLKPSPFCLLDEIEAALDDSNVGRFAGYLQKLTKNTQFIIITHRRGTMNAADRLYGITMQEKGVSTLVSVDLVENQLTQ